MKRSWLLTLFLVLGLAAPVRAADTIKLGFNIPLTGDIPDVGESSKNAAEMLKKKLNDAGGVEVGDKKYQWNSFTRTTSPSRIGPVRGPQAHHPG